MPAFFRPDRYPYCAARRTICSIILRLGDAVAFTGSADTGEGIRQHPRVRQQGVRVNIEADSLNAALLGPDAAPGSPSFDFFVREVVREMTSKTGQKCTAIRRVLVPAEHAAAATDAIAAALAKIVVGDPANRVGKHGTSREHGAAQVGGRGNSQVKRSGDDCLFA